MNDNLAQMYKEAHFEAQRRIAELEALIIEADAAYNIDRQPTDIETASIALVYMCHEGRAALDREANATHKQTPQGQIDLLNALLF